MRRSRLRCDLGAQVGHPRIAPHDGKCQPGLMSARDGGFARICSWLSLAHKCGETFVDDGVTFDRQSRSCGFLARGPKCHVATFSLDLLRHVVLNDINVGGGSLFVHLPPQRTPCASHLCIDMRAIASAACATLFSPRPPNWYTEHCAPSSKMTASVAPEANLDDPS